MPPRLIFPLILIVLALLTVPAQPLAALGNSHGPGWSDILNGGAALSLILVAGIVALLTSAAGRRRR